MIEQHGLLDLLHRPVDEAARGLLGMYLHTEFPDGATTALLTEVEAYGGIEDAASHAFGGRTERNRSMFAAAGTLYVYRSYGVHWCANVVTGEPDDGRAVLLRGGRPVRGREIMTHRRGRRDHLTDGPGKLCQALGITGSHDGSSVLEGPVRLLPGPRPAGEILTTPRVGISRETERPWRFVLVH